MSLARQIVMLLDVAKQPVPVRTLVAQIEELGGDTSAEAVHRRMHQMKQAGQARKEGDGWVLVDALPLQNLRAKWARDGQPKQTITQPPAVPPPVPSLRDRIVAALRENPGSTAKQLAELLGGLAKNEPASTLNMLCKYQRVRHEGEWPARRYFACDGERVKLPRTGKRKKSDADSGIAKAADAGALPNGELDAIVQAWMDSHAAWAAVREVSAGVQQDTSTVAASLARLCDAGTVIWRYVSALQRGKQYAPAQGRCAGDLQTSAAAGAVEALDTTAPVHDVRDLDIPPTTTDDGLRELAARDAAAAGSPTATSELSDFARTHLRRLEAELALSGDQLEGGCTVLDLANGIALDIEDLIGRACDQQADYRAIKALAGAAGLVRRAQLELLRAA